ncbi:hypothetical protein ACTWLT_02780 [Micromonospora sp. ZYX-F-536]|uniref:hypothetical protein n=1 Tax=Micromonospora sp. ZYX-F-536 TaxID=3457629 RepID=UPI00404076A9
MAFRTWGRLLLTALGVSVLAGAGQLGVAYGFGIIRLTGAFTGTTVNQWPAQLVWVGWFAANAAVAGAVLTGRLARRDGLPASTGRQLAVGAAAALGATVVAPLCMQPARAAELISIDPVWAVGICAVLGALIGAGAAIAVLLRPELGWNVAAMAGIVWVLALVSVLPSLGTTGPLPTVRLGVLEPTWLDDGAAQRLALLLLPIGALLAGAATAGLARWRGQVPLISGATGVAGPVLVAFAYLTAGPGDAVDRYQTTPYYGALIAVLAGALGAAAAALLRWPVRAGATDAQPIEPTDILRPLPAGPALPGTESADSAEPTAAAERAAAAKPTAAAVEPAGIGRAPSDGDTTATVRTVPAHWDWPATTASGQHGPSPADPTATEDVAVSRLAEGRSPRRTGGHTPTAPAAWLTEPTGEFTAARHGTSPSRDDETSTSPVVEPEPTVPASRPDVAPTGTESAPTTSDATLPSEPTPVSTPATATRTRADGPTRNDDDAASTAATATNSSAQPTSAATTSTTTTSTATTDTATTSTATAGAVQPASAAASDTGTSGTAQPTSADMADTGTASTGTTSAATADTGTASTGTTSAATSEAGATATPAPKPRRTRKPKSTPSATTPAVAGGTKPTDPEAAADPATKPAASKAGRTSGDARSGKAGGVSRPGEETPDPASRRGTRPTPVAGTDPAATSEPPAAAEPTATSTPAGAATDAANTTDTERSDTGRGPVEPLFQAATASKPEKDRWTPAAPAWPVTPAWTAPAQTSDAGSTAPDATTGPEEPTERTPRPRHRAPLPDLSRASSWDAFRTARPAGSADPQDSSPAVSPTASAGSAAAVEDAAPADSSSPTAPAGPATPAGRRSASDRAAARWRRATGMSDRAAEASDPGTPTGPTTPTSASPVAPEQTGPSEAASDTGDAASTDAGPAAPTPRGDADQPARRGRLGGLFRRNRSRTEEESATPSDTPEALPAQDEEFVDWVAGLGKPVADNEPEQENGRRSLRSTGRHHRD